MQTPISKTASKLDAGGGAYSDLTQLIALRHLSANLKLTLQRRALSAMSGPNRTHFRGRGIDFDEVRLYQAGDDIRSIDWRVTARTGKTHTKLFREERERPTLLIVDQRTPMFFGSRSCFKSVLAAQLSALLAWAALNNGDRVGGLVFNEQQHQEIRPKRNRNSVLQLLSMVDQFNHQLNKEKLARGTTQNLSDITADLMRIAKPGSAVFFISDLSGFDEETEKLFYRISRHNDVSCFFTYDELESQLPTAGHYNFSDGNQRFRLFTGNQSLRQHYHQSFVDRLATLQEKLGRLGIAMIPAPTHKPPLELLQHYFGTTKKRK